MPNQETIFKALVRYRRAANLARENAGFGGHMHDGGASVMHSRADAYEAGLHGTIPDFLADYVKEAEQAEDPEYATFLRLKKKFDKK